MYVHIYVCGRNSVRPCDLAAKLKINFLCL